MRWLALFLVACAPVAYVKPVDELLREAKLLGPDEACRLLTQALSTGDYSAQRKSADTMSALNAEFQLSNLRELSCRNAEKRTKRAAEIENETDLVLLRTLAWSGGEDEALRRRASDRLFSLLQNETRPDALSALADMIPPGGDLPAWYLASGVEQLLEDKLQAILRTPEESARVKAAEDAYQQLTATVAALVLSAVESKPVDKARLKADELRFCAAYLALTDRLRAGLDQKTQNHGEARCHE